MAFCSKCGANLPDGARFCNVCGAPQSGAPTQSYQQPQPYQQAPPYQQPQYFQQAPPTPPPAQKPPRKKKRGGFIKLLLFLLLLGGGYFGYQWMKDQGLFDIRRDPVPGDVISGDTDSPWEGDYSDDADDSGDSYSAIRDFLLGGSGGSDD